MSETVWKNGVRVHHEILGYGTVVNSRQIFKTVPMWKWNIETDDRCGTEVTEADRKGWHLVNSKKTKCPQCRAGLSVEVGPQPHGGLIAPSATDPVTGE